MTTGIEKNRAEMRRRASRERLLQRLDLLADLLADSIQALQAIDKLFQKTVQDEKESDENDNQPRRD